MFRSASVFGLITTFALGSSGAEGVRCKDIITLDSANPLEIGHLTTAISSCQEEEREEEVRLREFSRWQALLAGMEFRLAGAFSDNEGRVGGPGATSIPLKFDEEELTADAKVGWFGKPVLRDLYLLRGGDEAAERYLLDWKKDRIRWALLDAFKVDGWFGYGSQLENPEGNDNSQVRSGHNFYLGFSYKLPLERVFGFTPIDD